MTMIVVVNGALELTTHVLIAALLAIILVGTGRAMWYRDRFIQQLTADPGRRTRFYRDFIVRSWATAVLVPLTVFASADLSVVDVGWTWPSGDGIDYLLAACMLVITAVGALRAHRRAPRGEKVPIPAGTALILPQTPHERRLALAVAATAGITEEAIYRGLLIAAGTRLYDLPLALVVAAGLAVFVAAHAYQGRKGMVGVAVLGAVFTAIYLISGSLLLAILVHVWQNLVVLLLLPVRPSGPQPINDAGIQPGVEATVHAQSKPATTIDEQPPQPAHQHVVRPAVPS